MGRKLRFIGVEKINKYISEKEEIIQEILNNPTYFEYAKTFGKAAFYLKIKEFIERFKLDKNKSYGLKVFNVLSSFECINELFKRTYFQKLIKGNYEKSNVMSTFYVFVYLMNKELQEKSGNFHKSRDIDERLFVRYFLHFYLSTRPDGGRNVNYQDMVKYLLKGKIADIRERVLNLNGSTNYILIFNGKEVFNETGRSIKTLRKKGYKKLFYYILDNQDVLYSIKVK
ncbi:hypothetical protein [Persephonella sp.]